MLNSLPLDLPAHKDLVPIKICLSEGQQAELFSSWRKFVPDLYVTNEYTSSLYDAQESKLEENIEMRDEYCSDGEEEEEEGDEIYGCSCSSSPCCDLNDPATGENDDDCQCIGNFGEYITLDQVLCVFAISKLMANMKSSSSFLGQFITSDDTNSTPVLHLPHPTHLPLVECGLTCHSLSEEIQLCKNQISRAPIFPSLELRSSSISTFGIFTTQPIPQGAFVCTYAGEVITASTAKSRWLARSSRTQVAGDSLPERSGKHERYNGPSDKASGMNYIFCLRLGVRDVYIDAGAIGGIGRFFNHSHSPNIMPLPVFQPPSPSSSSRFRSRTQSSSSPTTTSTVELETNMLTDLTRARMEALTTPRIAFFANREIKSGEELCWDYGDGSAISSKPTVNVAAGADAADYKIEKDRLETSILNGEGRPGQESGRLPCFCQSQNCDGYLPFDDDL